MTAAASDQITRLEAAGTSLRWHVEDLALAALDLPPITRRQLARISDRLQAAGLSIEILDRGRTMVTIGSEQSSLVGRLAFGSPHIRPRLVWRWVQVYRSARRVS